MKNRALAIVLAVLAFTLACNMTDPVTSASVGNPIVSNTPVPLAATEPAPTQETAHVTGSWHIRAESNHASAIVGSLTDCDIVIVARYIASDMGIWLEIERGGFINARSVE